MMPAGKSVVIISSVAEPREKSTWSGTTLNLIKALEVAGVEVVTKTITPGRMVRRIFALLGKLLGWRMGEPDRIGPLHRLLQKRASAFAARSSHDCFLHFGSSHLPIIDPRPGQRHFLVTDYSIHLLMTRGPRRLSVGDGYAKAVLASERAIASGCDGIFTIAEYVRQDWLEEYGLPSDDVVAIGTGLGGYVGLDGHRKDYAAGHLLYVGKHGFDIKGGVLLLAGFDHALKQRPDLKLVIIADAGDPKLAPYMPAIHANPAIDFRQTGTPDFVELVRGAALYAAPAQFEPWGLIYLEALMAETPVLGLNRNAMMQLTDHGRVGFVVDEASAQSVGDAIVDAMSDPARLARMGREGRQFVERTFTWDLAARRILDTLEK